MDTSVLSSPAPVLVRGRDAERLGFPDGSTMTLLADDRVLVCGSAASTSAAQSCQVFNATFTALSASATMGARRFDHTATLLLDGRVLLTGGGGDASFLGGINLAVTSGAELYRP